MNDIIEQGGYKMTEPGRHKCPDCGNDMVKISSQNETLGRNEKVWDLAHTGVGTTIASTTSGANYSGVSVVQNEGFI